MTTQSMEFDAAVLPESEARSISLWQQLFWLLRREVWENRSIWIAPSVLAAVMVLAFFSTLPALPQHVAALHGPDPRLAHLNVHMPYGASAMAMIAVTFFVGLFYCADALQGERRDRSILFWKSMPVSDATTVLSKALIPLAVLPLVAFAFAVIVHVVILAVSTAWLLLQGGDVGLFIAHVGPIEFNITVLYAVIAAAVWHAPIYAWLLLVSAWARRAAFLWAIMPLLAIAAVQWTTMGTLGLFEWLRYISVGWVDAAFEFTDRMDTSMFDEVTPGTLFGTWTLWAGLAFTAACLAAAVYLRRHREAG